MSDKDLDIAVNEISTEFQLIAKAIAIKLKDLLASNGNTPEAKHFVTINTQTPFMKFSFMIPKDIDQQMKTETNSNVAMHKHARNLLNSALSAIRHELNNIASYKFTECNLQYTGFSISPFGFTVEVPKCRLVAVKLRKIVIEIIASLNLSELRAQALNNKDKAHKLPSEIIFAALNQRRQVAKSFKIAHNEYDVVEIEGQLKNVRQIMKESPRQAA